MKNAKVIFGEKTQEMGNLKFFYCKVCMHLTSAGFCSCESGQTLEQVVLRGCRGSIPGDEQVLCELLQLALLWEQGLDNPTLRSLGELCCDI